MEQHKLRWFTFPDLESFKKGFDQEKYTYNVCSLPLPRNKSVPPKCAAYFHPKKER